MPLGHWRWHNPEQLFVQNCFCVNNEIAIKAFRYWPFVPGIYRYPVDLPTPRMSYVECMSMPWRRHGHFLEVNIGSGNGLVPSGNKPLPKPVYIWWKGLLDMDTVPVWSLFTAICPGRMINRVTSGVFTVCCKTLQRLCRVNPWSTEDLMKWKRVTLTLIR